MRRKKPTHRRALNVAPNSSMIRLVGAGKAWLRVPILRSALGRRLRIRRRRWPSSLKLLPPRLGRHCRASRWTSPLPQGGYLICVSVSRLKVLSIRLTNPCALPAPPLLPLTWTLTKDQKKMKKPPLERVSLFNPVLSNRMSGRLTETFILLFLCSSARCRCAP